jgi:IS6 family transposase
VIAVAVRWYLRYGLSRRDVEELLAERGVTADHVTVYRWVQRFTPEFIEAARLHRHAPGDRWFADETYVKIAGRWSYPDRAVDQHGQVIDVLLSQRRDLAATRRFFTRALRAGTIPAETDHGRLKSRLRPMRGLKRHRSARILAPGTPLYRTSDAATTNSPSTPPPAEGDAGHLVADCLDSQAPAPDFPVSAFSARRRCGWFGQCGDARSEQAPHLILFAGI